MAYEYYKIAKPDMQR